MNYIVFDLEWNQCPYGKGQENERIPFEIIEIGAVKLNSERQIIDQYQVLIQPRVYKKLHHRTREIIQMDMKLLEREGIPFYRAVKEFLKWCGEDALFCSWGNSDLLELQRNMKYYGILQLLKGPIRYLDVQKLFSIDREDGDSRRSLEYAVDVLEIEKQQEFHRALADSWYTAKVLMRLRSEIVDTFYSIDCYQNPKRKEEEIKVFYPGYEKFISREFDSKEEAMADKEITSSRCHLCRKNIRKKIRWFAAGQKNYYCLAYCPVHGWMKGKIRMKKTEQGRVFAVKTMKYTTEEEAMEIRTKKKKSKEKDGPVRKEKNNMLVQGIHHVCIRCEKSEIEKVKEFYQGVLGMPVIRSWGEPELEGFMFDTGAGLVEVFTDAEGQLPQGSIRHFALKTDDVDGCVKAVREAGYPITVEPKDIVIPSQPEFPVRVAFCNGPTGEEIEFFQEK